MKWRKIIFLCLIVLAGFLGIFISKVNAGGVGDSVITNHAADVASKLPTGGDLYYKSNANPTLVYMIDKNNNIQAVTPEAKKLTGLPKDLKTGGYTPLPYGLEYETNNVKVKYNTSTGMYDLSSPSSNESFDPTKIQDALKNEIGKNHVQNETAKEGNFMCAGASGLGETLLCFIAQIFQSVLLNGMATITGVVGMAFNAIVNFTITEMGAHYTELKEPIEISWSILRDIINIMFIFVLLYYGILTIIHGYESNSKQIITVIVIALIINFSMFFTKLVVDTSNVLAIELYKSISNVGTASGGDTTNSAEAQAKQGIAGPFIEQLRIGSAFDYKKPEGASQMDFYFRLIIVATGGSILLFGLIVVLLIISLMLIVRFITLIFILVTSGAAVGSWILPELKGKVYDPWFSALIGESFFAPILFLFLYVSILVLSRVQEMVGVVDGNWAQILSGNAMNFAGKMALSYVLVLGFMIASVIIAKQLANQAGALHSTVSKYVGGATLGLAGFAGRRTLGQAGQSIAKRWQPTSGIGQFIKGKTVDKLAKGSYDLRGWSKFNQMNSDFGEGSKANRFERDKEKDRDKKEREANAKSKYEKATELSEAQVLEKARLKSIVDNNENYQKLKKLEKAQEEQREKVDLMPDGEDKVLEQEILNRMRTRIAEFIQNDIGRPELRALRRQDSELKRIDSEQKNKSNQEMIRLLREGNEAQRKLAATMINAKRPEGTNTDDIVRELRRIQQSGNNNQQQ